MKFSFNVNIEKKHVLALFILVAVAGIGFVIAETTLITWDNTKKVWHDASDVKVMFDANNDQTKEAYSLQELIDKKMLGGGEVTPPPGRVSYIQFNIKDGNQETYTESCPVKLVGMQNGTNYFAELSTPINTTGDLTLKSGSRYNFKCTYGAETQVQSNMINLDGNYKVVAQGTERHMKRDTALLSPRVYEGTDTFKFAVAFADNKLNLKIIRDCGGCSFYCAGYSNINNFCGSNVCPIYDAPKGLTRTTENIHAWKGISCTISEI